MPLMNFDDFIISDEEEDVLSIPLDDTFSVLSVNRQFNMPFAFPSDLLNQNTSSYEKLAYEEAREEMKMQKKLILAEKLLDLNEQDRERRKAEIEVLHIEAGILSVETKNTRHMHGTRKLANFLKPRMVTFKNVITQECCYYISFEVDEVCKEILIPKEYAGDGMYILNKLNSVGADFLTEKNSEKKKYARLLWVELLNNHNNIQEVPNIAGWFTDSNGKIQFCKREGDVTWEELKKHF